MKLRSPESQRDSVLQPKVARRALPWVGRRDCQQPHRGCARPRTAICRNPVGVDERYDSCSQGIATLNPGLNDVAPLGQIRWPSPCRIVTELDALLATVDALKRLQIESRRGLHPTLDADLNHAGEIDTSPLILSSIGAERKAAFCDRAFKSER